MSMQINIYVGERKRECVCYRGCAYILVNRNVYKTVNSSCLNVLLLSIYLSIYLSVSVCVCVCSRVFV